MSEPNYVPAEFVMREGDGFDTHEKIILRGFSKNRFAIYDVRQPDGSYVRVCSDPEWTGV